MCGGLLASILICPVALLFIYGMSRLRAQELTCTFFWPHGAMPPFFDAWYAVEHDSALWKAMWMCVLFKKRHYNFDKKRSILNAHTKILLHCMHAFGSAKKKAKTKLIFFPCAVRTQDCKAG